MGSNIGGVGHHAGAFGRVWRKFTDKGDSRQVRRGNAKRVQTIRRGHWLACALSVIGLLLGISLSLGAAAQAQIVNGDFSNGGTGWNDVLAGDGSISYSGGVATVNGNDNGEHFLTVSTQQTVTTGNILEFDLVSYNSPDIYEVYPYYDKPVFILDGVVYELNQDGTVTNSVNTGTVNNNNPAVSTIHYTVPVVAGQHKIGFGVYSQDGIEGAGTAIFDNVTSRNAPAPNVTSIKRQNPATETTDADSLTWRVTFSGKVKNVDAADFTVSGTTATVSNVATTDGTNFDVTVSGGDLANLNGTVSLGFAGGQDITDETGNALTDTTPTDANESFEVQNDSTAPTVEITGAPTSFADLSPFTVTFQWSEEVTGFTLDDITVGKGSASNFVTVDGDTYTADITPDGSGDITIDVAANVAKDIADNDNAAAKQVTISSTIVEQTQQAIGAFMLNRANNILGSQPDIAGFLNGSNNSGGGDLGNLQVNATSSHLDLAFSTSLSRIERARERNLQAVLKGGKANADQRALAAHRRVMGTHDKEDERTLAVGFSKDAGQGDNAERRLAMAYAPDAREQDTSDGLSKQTDAALARLQPRSGEQEAASSYGDSEMPANRFDVWTQIEGSASRAGDSRSSLWVGYVGAHYFLTPDLIVGALVQFDWADEQNSAAGSDVAGFGWMAGPYAAGRISGTSLSWEARAAWGQSDNTISPLGTYKDDFSTTRWMASAKIAGAFPVGTMTIRPTASVSYFEETQEAYTDSLTNTIPEQTISLGEVRFGPEFTWDLAQADGAIIRPKLGISGVYNFNVDSGNASQGFVLGEEDIRARFDAGITVTTALGWNLMFEGFLDGVGIDDYRAYGGKAKLTVPLH